MNKGLEKVIDITRSLKALREEMSVGAGGYTGAADPKGPVAGYDPVLNRVDRRKTVSYTHLTLPTTPYV